MAKTAMILWLSALGLFIGQSSQRAEAAEYFLRAGVTSITIPGTGETVAMWGFARDSGPSVQDGTITVPGPVLSVDPADPSLVVHLKNTLPTLNGQPTPVSLVIPGQVAAMTPVRHGNGRVRSFTHETLPGQIQDYVWSDLKPGTYLYQSGTHPAVQVQMGLYGAMKKDSSPGNVYPDRPYDREAVLLYSEIDPALHQAVATDSYGPGKSMTSTVNYSPKYFLLNGESYSATTSPISVGTPGQKVLLRILNAGLKTRVPALLGGELAMVAEDGRPYPFQKTEYSVLLPAGKAVDVMTSFTDAGRYAIYDRRLSAGMLGFLEVSARRARPGSTR